MSQALLLILCLFLVTDKDTFRLCFFALALYLVIVVVANLETNIFFEIERFFAYQGLQILVIPIRALNKSLTPVEEKEKQLDRVRSWEGNLKKYDEMIQQEIYLLDEKELLEERDTHGDGLTPGERVVLDRIRRELNTIRPRLRKIGQKFSQLRLEGASGSWTLEYSTVPLEKKWKEEEVICRVSFGCCARGCGCCKKPRLGRGGRREELYVSVPTHCTVACGCCVRWRSLKYLEGFKIENGRRILGADLSAHC